MKIQRLWKIVQGTKLTVFRLELLETLQEKFKMNAGGITISAATTEIVPALVSDCSLPKFSLCTQRIRECTQ